MEKKEGDFLDATNVFAYRTDQALYSMYKHDSFKKWYSDAADVTLFMSMLLSHNILGKSSYNIYIYIYIIYIYAHKCTETRKEE
jgi:hypothetical protein